MNLCGEKNVYLFYLLASSNISEIKVIANYIPINN